MHLFFQPDLSGGMLSADDSRHCIKVLRLKSGDPIEITDGKGTLINARIVVPDPRKTTFEVLSRIEKPVRNYSIHLAIAPSKNSDRIEWMVEKCVEIGVDKISFIECLKSERHSYKMERLQKIAINAMKQSQQCRLPLLAGMRPVQELIENTREAQRFIAYVDDQNTHYLSQHASPGSNYVVMIGPEGDFTESELVMATSNGFKKVSLGPNRLRTETAGMSAVMILNMLNIP